ncbi:MAG TPA: nucleotidyl transferase AbiEii/AbiGii toxin family protein [Dehalococcoidia bacterium]|nr:nucleotidyl transferase AbiEii/AbiGii toxin family protein [Dehalococcoidia bacterium]
MPSPERGRTGDGFREQLLARLRNEALRANVPAQRLQQQVVFERLLARLAAWDGWTLKGGFALEMRYGLENRPTRDVDLRAEGPIDAALDQLRAAIARETSDRLTYEVEAIRPLDNVPFGGARARLSVLLAGAQFGRFHLDISCGEALLDEPDILNGSGLLLFAGIAPVRFPAYPILQHRAEKLHAYTMPRTIENTRVKDLLDLVTIASRETVAGDRLSASVGATFARRGTHLLPPALPQPPAAWASAHEHLASEATGLSIRGIADGFRLVQSFWQPVLDGAAGGLHWEPGARTWLGA